MLMAKQLTFSVYCSQPQLQLNRRFDRDGRFFRNRQRSEFVGLVKALSLGKWADRSLFQSCRFALLSYSIIATLESEFALVPD